MICILATTIRRQTCTYIRHNCAEKIHNRTITEITEILPKNITSENSVLGDISTSRYSVHFTSLIEGLVFTSCKYPVKTQALLSSPRSLLQYFTDGSNQYLVRCLVLVFTAPGICRVNSSLEGAVCLVIAWLSCGTFDPKSQIIQIRYLVKRKHRRARIWYSYAQFSVGPSLIIRPLYPQFAFVILTTVISIDQLRFTVQRTTCLSVSCTCHDCSKTTMMSTPIFYGPPINLKF